MKAQRNPQNKWRSCFIEKTFHVHQYIESLPISKLLLGKINLKFYRKTLLAWLYSYRDLYSRLSQQHQVLVQPLILNLQFDLEEIGIEDTFLDLTMKSNRSPVESSGILYVLLGSTLGGRIISARLSSNADEMIKKNLKFITGHGQNYKQVWLDYCREMDHVEWTDKNLSLASENALEAFEIIAHHLNDIKVPMLKESSPVL